MRHCDIIPDLHIEIYFGILKRVLGRFAVGFSPVRLASGPRSPPRLGSRPVPPSGIGANKRVSCVRWRVQEASPRRRGGSVALSGGAARGGAS